MDLCWRALEKQGLKSLSISCNGKMGHEMDNWFGAVSAVLWVLGAGLMCHLGEVAYKASTLHVTSTAVLFLLS